MMPSLDWTATRLHGPEASIACRWGGGCKADEPRATSERSIGTWEGTKASHGLDLDAPKPVQAPGLAPVP